jgi:hypothetical protein
VGRGRRLYAPGRAAPGRHRGPADLLYGIGRDGDCGSPEHLKRAAEASLKRLGVDGLAGTSSIARTQPFPTPSRSARSGICSTPGRSGWQVSRTPFRPDPPGPERSSAAAWPPGRTSSRRPIAAANRNLSSATNWVSHSCRGARSAESPPLADVHVLSMTGADLDWPLSVATPRDRTPSTAASALIELVEEFLE